MCKLDYWIVDMKVVDKVLQQPAYAILIKVWSLQETIPTDISLCRASLEDVGERKGLSVDERTQYWPL